MRIVSEEEILAVKAALEKIEYQVRLIEEERRLLTVLLMAQPNGHILIESARLVAKANVSRRY